MLTLQLSNKAATVNRPVILEISGIKVTRESIPDWQIMRKLISFLLAITFLFNIGGYYLWFCVLQNNIQKEIKHEIRRGIKDDDLCLLILTPANEHTFHWIKPEKEFRHLGEMFDVVKSKIIIHKKYYYCIKDTREKQLIAIYNKTHNTKKDSEKRLKRAFSLNLFLQNIQSQHKIYTSIFKYPSLNIAYHSLSIHITSPPPRQA